MSPPESTSHKLRDVSSPTKPCQVALNILIRRDVMSFKDSHKSTSYPAEYSGKYQRVSRIQWQTNGLRLVPPSGLVIKLQHWWLLMLQQMIDNKRILFGQTDRYNVRLDERNILIKVTKINDCICLVHTCAHRVWKSKLVLCSTRLLFYAADQSGCFYKERSKPDTPLDQARPGIEAWVAWPLSKILQLWLT
jgi:hypothetical protein